MEYYPNYSRNQRIKPTAPDSLLSHNSHIPLRLSIRNAITLNYSFIVAAQLKSMGEKDEIHN